MPHQPESEKIKVIKQVRKRRRRQRFIKSLPVRDQLTGARVAGPPTRLT